jgi:predicted cupin superfamily sugar epimerase
MRSTAAPRRRRFSFSWPVANARTGTASTRSRSGTITPDYAGAPLKLEIVDGSTEEIFRLGADIHADEVPQVTVRARAWQAAESLGDWTLVGCTVAPGFSFEGFELAPKDWSPRA